MTTITRRKIERGDRGYADYEMIATPDVLRMLGSQILEQFNSPGGRPNHIQLAERRRSRERSDHV